MPKSSFEQINRDEKKILQEIKKNANNSINAIAKKFNFSRQKVWRILKKLEKEKTIWGYTAIVNEEKYGINKFFVLIKRSNTPLNQDLIKKIVSRDLEEVSLEVDIKINSSIYIHGEYDWIIIIEAEDIKKAKQFTEMLNKIYQGYIDEIHILQFLFPIKVHGIMNPDKDRLNEFI